MRRLTATVTIAGLLLLSGCGKKTETASGQGAAEKTKPASRPTSSVERQQLPPVPEEARAAVAPDATPDQVVMAFLEATRSGDEVLASQLLSEKALEATTNAGLIVKPPGTPSMQYEIGQVEYPQDAEDGAYVQSIWRERFADGEDRFDVTWVLRRQTDGWRIVGMAIPGGEEPFLVNFEEPDDLREKMGAGEQSDVGAMDDEMPASDQDGGVDATADRLTTPENTLR